MTLQARSRKVLDQLATMYKPYPGGGSGVDTNEVFALVRSDPEAVSNVLRLVLANGGAPAFGWGLCWVVALAFNQEHDDDSLLVLVKANAASAGVTLPAIKGWIPHGGAALQLEPKPLMVLEVPEGDVASGDAYRLAFLFQLKNLDANVRARMFGNCMLTFPAYGDPRPVPHIPRIRDYVADLHRRIPYFPLLLTLEPKHGMWMMYVGCLADPEATTVLAGDQIEFHGDHPTVQAALCESLAGVRHACSALGIDAQVHLTGLVSPFPEAIRRELINESAHWTP